MRKNLASLLQKGNLKPKERMLLLVHDIIKREREGKGILSEADKHALSEGWTPKDNGEAREYNRYQEGWKTAVFAEMDAQTTFLQATINLLRADRLVAYVVSKNRGGLGNKDAKEVKEQLASGKTELKKEYDLGFLKDIIESEQIKGQLTNEETLRLTLEYLGLEVEQTIYFYAFELASEELRKDILTLYPDAKGDRDFLEQEEIIYNLFKNKSELSQEEKGKLADLIAEEAYNEFSDKWYFSGYFGNLPIMEVGKRLANESGLYKEMKAKTDSELEKELQTLLPAYAENQKTTIKKLFKDTVIKWLNEGLFTKEITPIFKSETKATCNGTDTKLPHGEIFKQWLEVKAKATKIIQELIDKGELQTTQKTRTSKIKKLVDDMLENEPKEPKQTTQEREVKRTKTIITGESLYNFKGDFTFAKDFREQADELKIIGALVLFLRQCQFVKDYADLLAFDELFRRLSKTFEIDLTYKMESWKKRFASDLGFLKHNLLFMVDNLIEAGFRTDTVVYYLSEGYLEDLLLNPLDASTIKPNKEKITEYTKKLESLLGTDF